MSSDDEQRDRTRDKVQHYRKRARDEKAGRLAAEAERDALQIEHARLQAFTETLVGRIIPGDKCSTGEHFTRLDDGRCCICGSWPLVAGVPVDSEEKENPK